MVGDEDIKLSPRTALTGKGRIVSTEEIGEVFQMTSIEEYSPGEGEVACVSP